MQDHKSTISIIVPVYNVEDYIGECIESIVSQSHDSFELILVNDGSSDASGEICDKYSNKYDNVVSIHQQNQGVSIARNTGIEAAKGEWITFVDGDDGLCEGALQKAAQLLREDVDCYIFDSVRHVADGKTIKAYNFSDELDGKTLSAKDLFCKYKYSRNVIWGCVYRAKFLRENDLKFLRGVINSQDTIYFAFVHHYANKVHLSHIDFVEVNHREGSASRSWNIDRINRYTTYFKMVENELDRRGINPAESGCFRYLTFCLLSYLCSQMSLCKGVDYNKVQQAVDATALYPIDRLGTPAPTIHTAIINKSVRLYALCMQINRILRGR